LRKVVLRVNAHIYDIICVFDDDGGGDGGGGSDVMMLVLKGQRKKDR
jgi:hypothetical protein